MPSPTYLTTPVSCASRRGPPPPTTTTSSPRSKDGVAQLPLLSITQPALALGDGSGMDELTAVERANTLWHRELLRAGHGEFFRGLSGTVVKGLPGLIQDGNRYENVAWR